MFKGKNKVRLIAALLVVVMSVAFAGCDGLFPEEEDILTPPLVVPQSVTYKTEAVTRGDVVQKRSGNGSLISITQYNLSFTDSGGYLKEVFVRYGDNVTKGQLIAEYDTEALRESIKIQELVVEKARINFEKINRNTSISKDDKRLAQIDLEIQEINLKNLYRDLERARIYSPIDGVISYVTPSAVGDYIQARSTVAVVLDPTQLYFAFMVDDRDEFQVGTDVTVTLDSVKYSGKIVVAPASMPEDVPSAYKDALLVELEGLPEDARTGVTGKYDIITAESKNCIAVRESMVIKNGGSNYVYILEDGVKVEREVVVGIRGNSSVEILEGLEEGELLVK